MPGCASLVAGWAGGSSRGGSSKAPFPCQPPRGWRVGTQSVRRSRSVGPRLKPTSGVSFRSRLPRAPCTHRKGRGTSDWGTQRLSYHPAKGTAGPARGVPIAGTHSPSVGPNYRDFPATIHTVPRVSIHGVGRRSLGHEPGAVKGQMVPWGEVRPRDHAPRNIFTDQFE